MDAIKNKTLELLKEKLEFEESYLIGLKYDVEVAPSKEYKKKAQEQVNDLLKKSINLKIWYPAKKFMVLHLLILNHEDTFKL